MTAHRSRLGQVVVSHALRAAVWTMSALGMSAMGISALGMSACSTDSKKPDDASTSDAGSLDAHPDADAGLSADSLGLDTGGGDPAAFDTAAFDTAAFDTAAFDTGASDTSVSLDTFVPPDPATAKKISDLTYATPTPWADPIQDYVKAAKAKLNGASFQTAIHDLMPYDGKLYLGFGDANHKLGQGFPVPMRAFNDPSSAKAIDEFTAAEEQIDRYRKLGSELWVAGLDATEDGWLGNLYRGLPGAKWTKHRTVSTGVHVHDVTRYAGAIWAVGSGGTQAQRANGDIYGTLWRSADDGATVTIVDKAWNNGEGEARYVHLLPTDTGLLVFGFRLNGQGTLAELPHGIVKAPKDGDITIVPLPPTHGLKNVRVVGCWPIGNGAGIVTGVDILNSPKKLGAWRVDGKGVTPLGLGDFAVLDVHTEGDEVIVLGHGDATWPPAKTPASWAVAAWLSADLAKWTKVLTFASTDAVTAIAWWRGHLYIGSAAGQVWRAAGAWPQK